MMLLSDQRIKNLCASQSMIAPFIPELIRKVKGRNAISFGLSSYGYDIRLSPAEFLIFRHVPSTIVNPKRFNPQNLESVVLQSGEDGDYFIIPAHSYGLGVSLEKIQMPRNATAICMGKSTYARCGLIVNTTPLESSWVGHITLEVSNSSGTDCRIYANEGICQLLFFEGEPCETTYAAREGKYQDQPERVIFAKV